VSESFQSRSDPTGKNIKDCWPTDFNFKTNINSRGGRRKNIARESHGHRQYVDTANKFGRIIKILTKTRSSQC
jgi:hypothetical protein